MTKPRRLLFAIPLVLLIVVGGLTLRASSAQATQSKITFDFVGTGPDANTLTNPTVRFDNVTITADLLHNDRPPGVVLEGNVTIAVRTSDGLRFTMQTNQVSLVGSE